MVFFNVSSEVVEFPSFNKGIYPAALTTASIFSFAPKAAIGAASSVDEEAVTGFFSDSLF
jgi:hypothetical protein